MKIRVAVPGDAKRIAEIYKPYVDDTAISFELTAPEEEEMEARIVATLKNYPYLVAEDENGVVVGYAYAGKFRPREAYIHSVEMSIYIDRNCRRAGIGKALYAELEKILLRQNIYVVYANITFTDDPKDTHVNDDSVRFHEKLGYEFVGKHNRCGYKFGNWYGVCWLEKNLCDRPDVVSPFVSFAEIAGDYQS